MIVLLLVMAPNFHVSWDSHQEFVKAISEVLTHDIRQKIKESEYYSVMVDESTDVHVDQNILIYVKICVNRDPKTIFLKIKKLEGATADIIFNCFRSVMEEEGLSFHNIVGCATDGAAVMVGVKSGFITKLKSEAPHLVVIHCIAHRLALASGQAADSVKYLVKYQDLLNNIAGYFQNSLKNMEKLNQAFTNFMDMQNGNHVGLRFKKTFHTRWLSFEASVRAIMSNYEALLSIFVADTSARAQGLVHQMACYKFLAVTSFLLDVLEELCRLSKTMQTSNLFFLNIGSSIKLTAETIESFLNLDTPGKHYLSFLESVPTTVNMVDEVGEFEYHGHTLRFSERKR